MAWKFWCSKRTAGGSKLDVISCLNACQEKITRSHTARVFFKSSNACACRRGTLAHQDSLNGHCINIPRWRMGMGCGRYVWLWRTLLKISWAKFTSIFKVLAKHIYCTRFVKICIWTGWWTWTTSSTQGTTLFFWRNFKWIAVGWTLCAGSEIISKICLCPSVGSQRAIYWGQSYLSFISVT